LSDRVFIGGPTSVRGFSLRGIGPHDRGTRTLALYHHFLYVFLADSLGGDFGLETSAALSFPIVPDWKDFFKGHIFMNAGHASLYKDASYNLFRTMKDNLGVSVGYGFIFKVMNTARLELNMSVPLVKKEAFRVHEGLQIGIGVDFL